MNTSPLEPSTRVLIDQTLKNLGWEFEGKNQNIYLEQPKSEREKKLLKGKRPDYVLYSKESDKPLIVIEAKRPGERIDRALDQGINYAKVLDAPLVFATDGVFCKSYHTFANRTPILNGEEVDEFIREALALQYLTRYEVNTVSPKVQYDRKELISVFDEANNMLRGVGLRAGIERFGEFANILFLKLISESENYKRECGIQTSFDSACSWESIKKITPSARIDYINTTVYKRLNNLYDTEIFTNLTMQDDSILKEIMDKLDPLMLTDVDSDVKGDAFEYFLKASASSKNDLGEYFTPRHIVKTMVRLVNPQIGEKVYDPFCGTGGFLIESFRHIYNNMARTDSNMKILKESTVYGNEITNTARITKMNMILAGDGHSNINMLDSLANPVDGNSTYKDEKGMEHHNGYDVVLANMPYSQKTKHGNLYPLSSTNGDSICVQHCMKAIKSTADNGRMALVVPEGFLFRKDLTKTREYLLGNCQLQSIISLPQGVFLPYTGVKTNIIYATKVNKKVKSSERRKSFWYFDVKNDGYTLDNHRRKLDRPSDLVNYEEFRKLDDDQTENMLKVGFETIPLDKVRANSNILVGSRYREQKIISSKYDVVTIGDIATVVNGNAFPIALQGQKGSIPFYKVGDMNSDGNEIEMYISNNYVSIELAKEKKWSLAPSGTVIFPKIGAAIATNKKRILTEPAIFDNNVMGLVCSKRVLPKFLLYLLGSINISKWASLSNPPSISKDMVLQQQIPIPPLEKQLEIVKELENYQQIINGAKIIINNYKPTIPILKNIPMEQRCLEDIAEFNPSKREVRDLPTDTIVSFVPMADVRIFDKNLNNHQEKTIGEVIKGFTFFRDDDILLAKITPCFQNGKAGIASNLKNGIGFGSTEFIIIRANLNVAYPEWIYYHLNNFAFIEQGKRYMTGTAGQQRVDINFVKQFQIPIPSLKEQKNILKQIEAENALVAPSKQLVEVFSKKIRDRIAEVWGVSDD